MGRMFTIDFDQYFFRGGTKGDNIMSAANCIYPTQNRAAPLSWRVELLRCWNGTSETLSLS